MNWSIVLAIVFFVATVVLTVVLTRKVVKKKKPVWARNTKRLIGKGTNTPPELQVTFNGLPVDAVYQSVFIFFNKGTETIRKSDVAEAVAVQFKGAKMLRRPAILAKSKKANKLSVKQIVKDGNDSTEIDFLYLDHDDGVVIEVLHTKAEKIIYSGIIMGANELRYIGEFLPYRSPRWLNIVYAVAGIAGGAALAFLVPELAHLFGASQSVYSIVIPAILIIFLGIGLGRLVVEDIPSFYRYSKFPKWTGSLKLPWID